MKKIGFLFLALIFVMSGNTQNKNLIVFDDSDFDIEPLTLINTLSSDISPALVEGKLFFSSVPDKFFNKKALKKNKAFYETYEVLLDKNGKVSSDRNLVSGFGGKFHEGPVSYCHATGELYVTLSNTIDPDTIRKMISVENIRLRLAIMKKTDSQWKITQELPFNNDKFHFAHPAISLTGDTLIFSSDQDSETYGKSDLFMTIRKGGKWTEPKNLGKLVNTQGNEMFPTFLPGGLLAFASDGHPNGMGLLDIWYTSFPIPGEVKNAGAQINSPYDDFGLIINSNCKVGYFSSNRTGQGNDDIYSLRINSLYEDFTGKVIDERTGLPIEGSTLQLFDCDGISMAKIQSDKQGNFQFKFRKIKCPAIEVTKDGYSNDRKDVSGLSHYEFRLKRQDSYITIQIADKESGEKLTDAKLEVLEGKSDVSSLSKEGDHFRFKLDQDSDYVFYVSKNGYFPTQVNYTAKEKISPLVISLDRIVQGKQFLIEDLYYDLGKYDIRPDAMLVLDRLVKVLTENPEISIEIGSHTDCRASNNYNLKLSQNRSNSVVAYLVSKGISDTRLVAKGYGETQLVNKCADGVYCSEAEHQANRRTVIKILKIKN